MYTNVHWSNVHSEVNLPKKCTLVYISVHLLWIICITISLALQLLCISVHLLWIICITISLAFQLLCMIFSSFKTQESSIRVIKMIPKLFSSKAFLGLHPTFLPSYVSLKSACTVIVDGVHQAKH